MPRTEIVEHCALYLLNMARWEFLLGYEKRWTTFEVMSSVAATCHDMIKHKGAKKFSKDLWDIGKSVLEMVKCLSFDSFQELLAETKWLLIVLTAFWRGFRDL